MTLVPVLETARLRVRGHTLADFDAVADMWADPIVTRHIGGKPSAREESWARMLRYPGMWALLSYGFWAIEEKASGRFVGEIGFADFHREIEPAIDAPEQGWSLAPWAHGQGYASEALAETVRWGESHLGRRDFVCIISPENLASIRVAEKAGYAEVGRTTYKGTPTLVFRRG